MDKVSKYLSDLQRGGDICFSSENYAKSLKISSLAAKNSLLRLRKQRIIASPRQGFHIILRPSDYDSGCRPAEEFIDYLMQYLNSAYYVSLLSAAEIYGSAHHRPQTYQVMTSVNRRPVACGKTKIDFYAKSNIENYPVNKHKVSTGYIKVSTPEVTAFDLVAYQDASGGLDHVSTVIAELSESIDAKKLKSISALFKITFGQRLGFILETIGQEKLAFSLESAIKKRIRKTTTLMPSKSVKNAKISKRWQLILNETIEPEI